MYVSTVYSVEMYDVVSKVPWLGLRISKFSYESRPGSDRGRATSVRDDRFVVLLS